MLGIAPVPASRGPSLPLHLSVAQRDPSSAPYSSTSPHPPTHRAQSDADARALVDAQRLKLARVRMSEEWADRLMMRERSAVGDVQRATAFLQPHHWTTILHERHLTSLCSYPVCSRPPAHPFSSSPRYRLVALPSRSSSGKRRRHDFIKEVGNPADGFCSRACAARGTWVGRRLRDEPVWVRELEEEQGRREWEVDEMLEELEADGRFRLEGEEEAIVAAGTASSDEKTSGKHPPDSPRGHEVAAYEVDLPPTVEVATPMASIQPLFPHEESASGAGKGQHAIIPAGTVPPRKQTPKNVKSPRKATAEPATPSETPSKGISDLVANLRIIEHPIETASIPAPPSLGPAAREGLSALAPPSRPAAAPAKGVAAESGPARKASDRERERRRFLGAGGGPFLSRDTAGLLSSQVVNASRDAAELHAKDGLDVDDDDEDAEGGESEIDEEQALEDMIFEQMMAARQEAGEE